MYRTSFSKLLIIPQYLYRVLGDKPHILSQYFRFQKARGGVRVNGKVSYTTIHTVEVRRFSSPALLTHGAPSAGSGGHGVVGGQKAHETQTLERSQRHYCCCGLFVFF